MNPGSYPFRILLLCVAVASFGLILAGCGGEEAPSESVGGPVEVTSETPSTPADVGPALHGTITFSGTPPEREVLETEGDPKCAMMHQDSPLLGDRTVVGPNGGLAYAFVYVKNPPAGEYTSSMGGTPVLDQTKCRYEPHVMGVVAGEDWLVKNSDPTVHNVRSFSRANRAFNISTPPDTDPRSRTFEEPEMEIKMKCDIHPWMQAYMFAMEHPFFATSDTSGAFAIPGLPAGEYTVVAWHEVYGTQEKTVTVDESGAGSIDFTFDAADTD